MDGHSDYRGALKCLSRWPHRISHPHGHRLWSRLTKGKRDHDMIGNGHGHAATPPHLISWTQRHPPFAFLPFKCPCTSQK